MKKLSKGFTLIELLVVMAIIAILAAVGMASYRSANERARNSRRAADLEQVRAALEMYRADNPTYPTVANYGALFGGGAPLNGYINAKPVDPLGGGDYRYCQSGGTTYQLCATFEGSNPGTCTVCGGGNYGVNNP